MNKVAIIGLGYVGLPLAVEFGKILDTVGFDINRKRIDELKNGNDFTKEVNKNELVESEKLTFTYDTADIADATVYIITVPTPIDSHNNPDLTPLIKASEMIGKLLSKNDIVIYESTVFPGCTEEVCVPILELNSGLKFNIDFFCGYSPERINPGDKEHRLPSIKKVTSGSTVEIANKVDDLYKKIITAGTFKASSIKVAEAAKVIENSQRDLNIAFVNELAMIFDRVGIDTHEVLEAAGTKWNFLPFKPGLVGGHCIGVDPYYLTYKAESLGYNPQVILAGRRINDNMGMYVANKVIKLMSNKGNPISKSRILVLGITFKENCPDIRNSRVIDVIDELTDFGATIEVYDPEADKEEVKHEYKIELTETLNGTYNAIILAVGHNQFKNIDLKNLTDEKSVIYDVKAYLEPSTITARL
ncbi:nucleotide sugar dehydrogenase [Fulvivirga lutea]|uniref:Nucleotide sugar dehydrogenase n=1 Tax=Fulvivirga lutea TaxID=2810512 RepID=A0A974WJQ7_9BACT|nr:nucleotide sugar dehydrogenase [Fulvivirga lutea]QSE98417.1 nucleotide sugar dehydrogenase [Fulvivirga lutea]